MKRKFNEGGYVPQTIPNTPNRVGPVVKDIYAEGDENNARNLLEKIVKNTEPNEKSVMMPGAPGLYKPNNRTGPVNPVTIGLNPDDSPIMTRGKQPPLPANFVEEAVPELPMKVSRSDLPMRRRRPMTPYGKPAFAKGGSVKSKGIDGCAQRGKTRGKYL